MIRSLKRHYHWVIAVIIFIEMAVYGGFANCISLFTIPVTEDLGISRGLYSLITTARPITSFLGTFLAGVLFSRFSCRKLITGALILTGIALVLMGLFRTPFMLGLSFALIGLSYSFCATLGYVRLVKSWFHQSQGLIMGAVSMATGLGGSVLSIWLADIIAKSNWRFAGWFTALLMILTAALCLALRDEPGELGLKPYGVGQPLKKAKVKLPHDHDWEGFSMGVLLRRPSFYLMSFCTLLSCINVHLTFTVVVPHFQDTGYSPSQAALFQSVLLFALAAAKLGAGWLTDKIGAKWITILCVGCAAAGQWILASNANLVLSYIGIFCLAIALLLTVLTIPLLTMPLFGHRSYGTLCSIFLAMASLGNMIATPLINLLHDWIGSYSPVFRVAAVLDVVLVGLFALLFYLCKRDKMNQKKDLSL